MLATTLVLAASYLLGAVPFGLVLVRLVKGVDLRTLGSGNIGATNAMRALGKPLGSVAFLCDFAKGYAPAAWLAPLAAGSQGAPSAAWLGVLCGGAAVAGHVWPVYLGFRGGKAVATGCGAILALDPVVFLGGGLVWLAVLALTRIVSLASLSLGLAFPVCAALRRSPERPGPELLYGTAALALLILVRHRSNLGRLLRGTEPRIGTKPKEGRGGHGS